jgi:cytochrome c
MKSYAIAAALLLVGGAAQAQDAAAGEEVFARRCSVCHMVVNDAGETIVKGGQTGPNQWAIIGRTAGTQADFGRYGDDLVAAGEAGLVWSEAEVVQYLEDPRGFLQAKLGDSGARSRMAFKLNDEQDRKDVAAYLTTLQ